MSKRNFENELNHFEKWLITLGYVKGTIKARKRHVKRFLDFIAQHKIKDLTEINIQTLQQYQEAIEKLPLSVSSLSQHIGALKLFDSYLLAYERPPIIQTHFKKYIHTTSEISILSQKEIQQLYLQTDHSLLGYRDRALLAIYYGCGLRASEGKNLELNDLDFTKKLLQVRKSKTKTPRYVPMSEKVIHDLKEYIDYSRKLILKVESTHLLVHGNGQYKHTTSLYNRVNYLLEKAHINKKIGLHSLRHSIATHLLENGMNLESISQFLGHESLETTQLYTHLKHKYAP